MDTLRVDTAVAGPAVEISAARPAPAARPVSSRAPADPGSDGPEPATRRPKTEDESSAPANGREATASPGGADEAAMRTALRATADELKSELKALGRHSLDISFEEENRRYVVRIRDTESGELIRQIPPEDLLEASRRLNELRGLLFDDRS